MIKIDFPSVTFPIQGLEEVVLPRMVRVRQLYAKDRIEDIPAHLREELSQKDYAALVKGKNIAVTVGSRGIPNNAVIVRTICDQLKEWGAEPFIVPAMGSHGGGTAEGNLEVLTGYGITEENIGVPVRASMDVIKQQGQAPHGLQGRARERAAQDDGDRPGKTSRMQRPAQAGI